VCCTKLLTYLNLLCVPSTNITFFLKQQRIVCLELCYITVSFVRQSESQLCSNSNAIQFTNDLSSIWKYSLPLKLPLALIPWNTSSWNRFILYSLFIFIHFITSHDSYVNKETDLRLSGRQGHWNYFFTTARKMALGSMSARVFLPDGIRAYPSHSLVCRLSECKI
jgi:hypothetical protein